MDETKADALVRREAQLGQVGLRELVASLARCRETAVVQATTVDDVGFRRRRDGGLVMNQAARVRISERRQGQERLAHPVETFRRQETFSDHFRKLVVVVVEHNDLCDPRKPESALMP